jgi:putative ABC transport system ATP-binding protein
MIELSGIRKAYNEGHPNQIWAVDGIDLALEMGRITVFTGPSGSGKSTLLGVIGGLTRPTEGRVRLEGEVISALTEQFLTRLRRERFGFIFQRFNLISWLTVVENVMLPAYPLGHPHPQLLGKTHELLERLGLTHRAESPAEWLSGGEAQRVATARALINDPPVVIADEPTAHLDSAMSREFLGIVESLRDEGRTVLIASHDPLIYQSELVDRRVSMRDGRLVEEGA